MSGYEAYGQNVNWGPAWVFADGLLTKAPGNYSVEAVTRADRSRSLPRVLADDLHQAFTDHGQATRRPWQASITALGDASPAGSDATPAVVHVHLTADDARALARLLRAHASAAVSGTLLGTADVAERIGYSKSTITSWLARGLPRHNPFPPPVKHLDRNAWDTATIDAWLNRQQR
jgi:predicted DNA-binding transcriptional regulator AlpA